MSRPPHLGLTLIGIALASTGSSCSWSQIASGPPPRPPLATRAIPPLSGASQFTNSVTVHLEKIAASLTTVSFGLPFRLGSLARIDALRVRVRGALVPVNAAEILAEHDATGARLGVRAALIQLPASLLSDAAIDAEISWNGGEGAAPSSVLLPFAQASMESPMVVETATRTIASRGHDLHLEESGRSKKTLFVGREPRVLATFPDGYIGYTGILGEVAPASAVGASPQSGLRYLSAAFRAFALSSMYVESYPLNPHPQSVIDPVTQYEGWLYDRCATYLLAYAHLGDSRFLRMGDRTCSYFADRIDVDGPRAGLFRGKPDADPKYSHLRGLYAYYALTGDEGARAAGVAIAEMWYADETFVAPYRQGHLRGPEKLWTELLLAASLEGLYYGFELTGEDKYLVAFGQLLDTAVRHITGDAGDLAKVNPGFTFPPQGCFVHSGQQQSEADRGDPWCSPWMSELLVEPLLRYQALTGDKRIDEIFIRLARFLRDVGTTYFDDNPLDDTFFAPDVCDNPAAGEHRRRLVPLYGAGLRADGTRAQFGQRSDFEHCADATLLTAAALRALKRQGTYDMHPIGPFPSEGASILQLHQELSSCAARVFEEQTRTRRDPSQWTGRDLAEATGDPADFIEANKIGFPLHIESPQRKLSWWFNGSMLQLGLLGEVGIAIPALQSGMIQAKNCPPTPHH